MRGVSPELQQAARQMRAAPTPAEAALWEALRGRRLDGLRFRSQHPLGQFVLDFYCPARRLAVEVDGGFHDARADQDAARTAVLAAYGIRVLRVRNGDVLTGLPAVLDAIRRAAQEAAGVGPLTPGSAP